MLNLDADSMFYAVLNFDSFLINLSDHSSFSKPNFNAKIFNPESQKSPIKSEFSLEYLRLYNYFNGSLF
jgi:hypothetical protein